MTIADIHMDHLNKLVRKDLIDGMLDLGFESNRLFDAFQNRNQVWASFKAKNIVSTDRPL